MRMFFERPETQAPAAFFVACLLLLNLPNFFWLDSFSPGLLNVTEFVERLLLCLLLSAVFLTLFSSPRWAWRVLWLFCLCWQPLALGVRAMNGVPINATLVGMAMATSPAELRNLAAIIPWPWFAFLCSGTLRAGVYGAPCAAAHTGAGPGRFAARCFFLRRHAGPALRGAAQPVC